MKFHPIHIDPASGILLPESMNNPFCYEPHPLCIMACKELQEKIAQRDDWREEIDRGKMFGVLIVEKPRKDGEATEPQTGYIAAYSGQIGGRSDWSGFVPAVFDYLKPDGYFKKHESDISDINVAIHDLQNDERMKQIKTEIDTLKARWQRDIDAYQLQMKAAKAQRDARRKAGNLSEEEKAEMVRESQFMKAQLRRLKKERDRKTDIEEEYDRNQKDIRYLKQLRKELSDSLQQWLFGKFSMLNPQVQLRLVFFRPRAGGLGQHPLQDGLALAVAGRIEVQVMAYFFLRTFSPPEHGHLQRTITVAVGILQQLGCAAVASPSRRNAVRGGAEYVYEVALFATCVEHAVLREEPALQFVAHASATLSQCSHALVVLLCKGMSSRKLGIEALLESAKVSLQRLTLACHGSRFSLADVHESCLGITATAVALSLCACYALLHGSNTVGSLLSQLLLTGLCALIISRMAYAVYLLIYIRDDAFGSLKVSVGLLCIEYGRHKIIPVVATGKQSGVSGNKS